VRARLFFTEALRSVSGNLSTTVAATMTVLIAMFLFGSVIGLGTWVRSWTTNVKNDLVVKVFFQKEALPQDVEAVRLKLAGLPQVKEIGFVSAEEGLAEMRRRYPQITENLASNPLGPRFDVMAHDGSQVKAISAALKPLPSGVDKVRDGGERSDRILTVAWVFGIIFIVGAVILLVASTLLIANTIRLSIFSRRREIEVMKLVGATNWFVRGPFMLEGLLCGLAGSIAAVLLLLVVREAALPAVLGDIDTGANDGVRALSFPLTALILVGFSLVIGALGSGLTLRRFLRI
jgi:cell division transport system permease protein